MKKSNLHMYPRPVTRKSRSFFSRFFPLFLACVVVAAGFSWFHEDGLKLAFLSPSASSMMADTSAVMSADAGNKSGLDNSPNAPEWQGVSASAELLASTPLPSVSLPERSSTDQVQPRDLAAMAAAVEEEAEKPGMLQAALGEGLNTLKSLPFFLPSPYEDEAADATDAEDTSFGQTQGRDDQSGESADTSASDNTAVNTADNEADGASDGAFDGPVVYEKNERYTVQTLDDGSRIFYSLVAKGDTAGVILNEWLNASDVATMISATEKVNSLASIREGRPFSIQCDNQGNFVRFSYEVDNKQCLVVDSEASAFRATMEPIEYDTELVHVNGTINSSLFESVADSGEGPVLAVNMAEVFSCEINFINEIRQGDSFDVLVEKRYRDGEFKGYGNLLAARFVNQGKLYEAFLFPDATGRPRHYNAKGEALQKTLLKAPLSFTRVSSGYSMNRKHPVFGNTRPHQGVDYAAPTGTPIKAVGDGVLTRVGWGNGYGNMVVIKHAGGLESQYAHMSAFAKGMKKGLRVKQGQTIGYVGATGVATGPHLDFRLKQNGKFINPTKVIVPREDPVNKKNLPDFMKTMALSKAYLEGEHELAQYLPPEWSK